MNTPMHTHGMAFMPIFSKNPFPELSFPPSLGVAATDDASAVLLFHLLMFFFCAIRLFVNSRYVNSALNVLQICKFKSNKYHKQEISGKLPRRIERKTLIRRSM
jgi:hypothetical protein